MKSVDVTYRVVVVPDEGETFEDALRKLLERVERCCVAYGLPMNFVGVGNVQEVKGGQV